MGEVLNVIVAFAVIVFAVRWATKGKEQPNSPGVVLGFRPKNVTDEMVNSVQIMFPAIPRPNIHYSLLRTGSVQVTSNTIIEKGFLDAPPAAYYTLYPQQQRQQQQPLPVPQPATRNEPPPAKKGTESLIKRFHLESRVKEDTPTEPENAGGKATWEATTEAREKSLQERKAQMILAARRRWLEQQQKSDNAEYKEAFALFDKKGTGAIPRDVLGDLLRALGQNPTQAEVADIVSKAPREGKVFPLLVDYKSFLTILNRTDGFKPAGTPEEFIRGFQVFDKEGNGYIGAGELRYVLTQLGEKMTDEEVDELLKGVQIGADGNVNYESFVRTILSQ
ncbi:hypothetical protein BJ322DRAFT_1106017 [Thelephora terrestris]|uniref:Calmodulin n=1 Tax=Thelephora terrestris TaxID=56493 RepID=A0A9P6L934_9AGAM|nr:hypothetical protein BJ322DRAFT_1106017 [Thelephora terrestris]